LTNPLAANINEKVGYKIREAQMEKVPYMLVVGLIVNETRTKGNK
jgi:threonyl-tRNA synthetase